MKKFWMICAAMAIAVSCSESFDEVDGSITEDQTAEAAISLTISMPQSEDEVTTRIGSDYGSADENTWKFTWNANDDDDVYAFSFSNSAKGKFNSLSSTDMTEGASTATFSGDISTSVETLSWYRVIYSRETVVWNNTSLGSLGTIGNVTSIVSLSAQNGDLDNLIMMSDIVDDDAEIASLTSSSSPSLTSKAIDLRHAGGFMVLDISFANVPESDWSGVTYDKIEYSGVNSQAELYLSKDVDDDGFYTSPTKGTITVTLDTPVAVASAKDIYLNIFPTELEENDVIEVTIFFSNNKKLVVTKTISGTASLNRGEFNTTTVAYDFESTGDVTGSQSTTTYSMEDYYIFDDVEFDATTSGNYEIASAADVVELSNLANSGFLGSSSNSYSFTLTDDIDMSGVEGFVPIGGYYHSTTYKAFVGVFDGAGHSIKNLTVGENGAVSISNGLFGYIVGSSTVVKNLLLENVDVETTTEGQHSGILVGTLQGGATLLNCGCDSNCSVTSTRGAVGGLVGYAAGDTSNTSKIYNCYNQGSVESTYSGGDNANIGGLCGYVSYADFEICYNSGTVTVSGGETSLYIGAFVGQNGNDSYANCYYLTGCAGSGVLAVATVSGTSGASEEHTGITGLSESEFTNTYSSGITVYLDYYAEISNITGICGWTNTSGTYPTLTFAAPTTIY